MTSHRCSPLALLATLLLAEPGQAAEIPDPPLGGCFGSGLLCAGAVVPAELGGLRLSSPGAGTYRAGIAGGGGAGYALHLWWRRWHTLSLAAAGSATSGSPGGASLSLLAGFAKYLVAGVSLHLAPGDRGLYLVAGVDVLSVVTEPATRAARASLEKTSPER